MSYFDLNQVARIATNTSLLLYPSHYVSTVSERQICFSACAVSKAEGQLEAIRAAADEAELQQRIAKAIERESRLDSMDVHEANAYSRDLVRDVHDGHLDELRKEEIERQKAEKLRRRRRRAV